MDKENEQFTKVRILADLPKFKERYTSDEDAFLHKTYADTILEIITNSENKPPMSIGLFGSWGIGKSSIINIIKNESEKSNIVPIYFNAWKYSGDSFRRQFLLTVIEELYRDRKEKMKISNRIKYLFHRSLPAEKSFKEEIQALFKNIRPKQSTILSIAIVAIVTIPFFVYGLFTQNYPTSVASIIMGIIVFLLTQQLPNIFQVTVPSEDPQLILPEQFEEEFFNLINPDRRKYHKAFKFMKGKRFITIIDDVDRCHPNTIITILNSVKTFLNERSRKCYFLTALDDDSVLDILKERNKQYEHEELMKFFDVVIRVNPLMGPDLIRFSNRIVEEMKESYTYGEKLVDIVQICIYGGFQNARQIKYFLNSFQAKLFIAHKRFQEGDFFKDPNEILEQLAKFAVIEDKYPEIARDIIQNPELLSQLQDRSGLPTANKNVDHTNIIFKKFPYFKKFLWETREIYIENIEWLSFLKISKYESQLPQVSKLRVAILSFERESLKEGLKNITDQNREEALVGFLSEKMESARAIQLGNTVDSSLWVMENFEFKESGLKQKLAESVCKTYIKPQNKLFDRDMILLFKAAQLSKRSPYWIKNIKEIGSKEIVSLSIPEHPEKIGNFLNFTYDRNLIEDNTAMSINNKFLEWQKEHLDRILKIFDFLKSSEKLNEQRRKKSIQIPDDKMLIALISNIQSDDEKVDFYGRIKNILYKFWNSSLAEPLSERLNMIFSKQTTKNEFEGATKFAIETIIDMPSWIAESQSLATAQHTWRFYSGYGQGDGRIMVLKAMLKATSTIPPQKQVNQNSLRQEYLNQIQTFTEEETKEMYNFIKHKTIDWWKNLLNDYILKIFQLIQQRKNDPAYCTSHLGFIWGRSRGIIPGEDFYSFFLILIDPQTVNDDMLREWSKILEMYVPKLKNELRNNYIAELQKNTENMQINISLERRKIYSNLALFLTGNQAGDKQLEIGTKYLTYLRNPNNGLQAIGIEFLPKVKEILAPEDFKLYFDNVAKDIFQKPFNEIIQYKGSILKIVEFDEYLDQKSVNLFSNILLQCFDVNQQPSIIDFGVELLLKAKRLSKRAEITRAIANLAKTSENSTKERWKDLLFRKKNLLDKEQLKVILKKYKKGKFRPQS